MERKVTWMKFNLSWMNLTTSMHLVIWRNLTWHKIKWNYIHRLVWPSSQYGWIWSKQPLKLSMLFWSMKSNLIHNMSNFIHIAKIHPCHSYHPCQVNLIHIMVFRMIQFHPCAQFLFLSSWFFFIHVKFTKTSCKQMFVNHVIQPWIDELHDFFHNLNIKFIMQPMICKGRWLMS